MNYENILNLLKGNGYTTAYNTWYHDDLMKESVNAMLEKIWYSGKETENELKEEKKDVKSKPELHSTTISKKEEEPDGIVW